MMSKNCLKMDDVPEFLKPYIGTGKMPRDMDSSGFATKVQNI